ncbi:Serine/threonine-protein kinase 36 [Gonapodya sp. JEL0774]|nr:Serine/threonine-protein kinase 36 [Gonapodya sp. JEL0774]
MSIKLQVPRMTFGSQSRNPSPSAAMPKLPFGRGSTVVTANRARWNIAQDVFGSGSFAVVRNAINLETGEKAIVKMCSMAPSDAPANHTLYAWRELATLAHASSLQHPNIVRLLDAAVVGDAVYIFEEKLEGVELFQFLTENGGKLPTQTVRHITAQLLSALNFLHEHQILHRDIKLDNIFIDPKTYHITLIDFNLSTFFHSDIPIIEPVGCVNYSSPQVLAASRGYPYMPEHGFSDLWALGVAVYGMLVGFFPFRSEDARHLTREHNALSTAPLRWYGPEVDPLARNFVERILSPFSEGKISAWLLMHDPFVAGHESFEANAKLAETVHPLAKLVSEDEDLVSRDLDVQLEAAKRFVGSFVQWNTHREIAKARSASPLPLLDSNLLSVPGASLDGRRSSASTVASTSSRASSSDSARTMVSIDTVSDAASVSSKSSNRSWKVFGSRGGHLKNGVVEGRKSSLGGMFGWKKI